MTPYRTSFDIRDYVIAASGGRNEKEIESRCNAIYFQIGTINAPGDAAPTGATLDFILRNLAPKVNGIQVFPYISGDGAFSAATDKRALERNPHVLAFESPDQYGIIEDYFKISCNVVPGYNFPLIVQVIRKYVTFQAAPQLK